MRRALLLLAAAATGCACPGGEEVRVSGATELTFCARVADTEAERREGLRGQPPLAAGEALLLPFAVEDEICIVNDGVSFPIDVLYAASDGRVVAIERGVPAGDATPRCVGGVRSVLEVAAGALDGAAPSDRLVR